MCYVALRYYVYKASGLGSFSLGMGWGIFFQCEVRPPREQLIMNSREADSADWCFLSSGT